MKIRTTIEIDDELLARAKRALGHTTTRATVEEALRRVAHCAEAERSEQAERQKRFLSRVLDRVDANVLASGEMWR